MSPSQLLRYRFETLAQARRHVHMVEERQLLFYPDPMGRLRERQPVMMELCFDESEQCASALGEVHSVESGAMRGAWVEIFSRNLLPELREAFLVRRRKHPRVPAMGMVRAERPGRDGVVGRIADVSIGGVRLAGVTAAWKPGDEVLLNELAGGLPLRARVAWCRSGELGVQFERRDPQTRMLAGKLLEAATKRWTSSLAAHHPVSCACTRGGPVMEPLLPRAAHRRAEGL
jgi:hypothetical protein